MAEQYDPFLPHRVDESIEHVTSTANDMSEQMRTNQDVRLISALQRQYGPEHERYQQALRRVEKRLVEQYISQERRSADLPDLPTMPLRVPQFAQRWKVQQERGKGNLKTMEIKQSAAPSFTKFGGRLSLAAVILVMLASMFAAFTYVHQRTTTGGGGTITIPISGKTKHTPTPTPKLPIGTTLYTTPSNPMGFASLSWSPDSKRVASLADKVQIWDATTGKHLVTVQMPDGTNELAYGLDWSPTSQEMAVATNEHVVIVNGETGKVIRTYSANTTATTNPNTTGSSGTSYLSSQFPASGGLGFRATAWSPNGKLMASALSAGINGEIQVWNPQTDIFGFNLKLTSSSYNIGALSWSSDGQYIAANTFNTQGVGTNPNQPTNQIVVWSIATHQIIFQHDDLLMSSDAPVIWQPHSHNITFTGSTISGSNSIATLKIWNAVTGKQVKQFVGKGYIGMAWSPDGKYLAYDGYSGNPPAIAVIIMNVATGKQIYAYKNHHYNVSVIAWSPNGKYIVSGEGNTMGNLVAKVWVAE
jgi:WD40 repeat protein